MVLKKAVIERIKNIIKNHHNMLLISMLGEKRLNPEQLKALKKAGLNPNKYAAAKSILNLAYNHNVQNEDGDHRAPKTIDQAQEQQAKGTYQGEAHQEAIEHLNANMEQLIDKQAFDVMSRIEGLIRDNNNEYRFDALQNLDRAEALDEVVKKNTVSKLKQLLRDTSKDSNRNWSRIAATEISNAVGLGSVDRIVMDNRTKNAGEVYVYRVNPNDAATCKYCRKFYIDSDQSPKVYRLSTIMGNGSNYGLKAAEWKPVSTATHPNCRDSQVLELRPGFKLLPGGKVEFIGLEEWREYIAKKVTD